MAVAKPEDYLADLNPAQREAVLDHRGPAARDRRRRLGQDARPHLPRRAPARGLRREAERDPRDHVHEQGRRRDARAPRGPARPASRARSGSSPSTPPAAGSCAARPRGSATARTSRSTTRPTRCGSSSSASRSSSATRSASSRAASTRRSRTRRTSSSARTSTRARVATFYDQTVADVYELYQRRLFASNAVDFDDLLMLTVEVLERFPEARERWQKAFRYVLVDEYQDTNHAQYRLLQLLAGEHRNLWSVGDPDQSIYALRGADIRNILEFERDFPGDAGRSRSSRTTARRTRSSTRRTRSSRTTASARRRTSGRSSARASRCA